MDSKEDVRRINEGIAARFHKVEASINDAVNVAVLFETLFTAIEQEFRVPFVWLTLLNTESNLSIIAAVKSSAVLKDRLNVMESGLFREILPGGLKPLLVNKDLQPYYRLLPADKKFFVRSLALVPFKINDEIAGSWNNGDAYYNRYTPDMETDLLQKLAQSISVKLTSLVSAGK